MKRRALFVFILLFWTFACYAQVEKGDSEIRFLGYLNRVSGDEYSSTSGSVQISYGYFITPKLQIGAGPQLTFSDGLDDGMDVQFSASVFFNYSISVGSKTVPYITGQWYQSDFSPPENGEFTDNSFITFGFGVRNFFTEYAALNTAIFYGKSLNSDMDGGLLMIMSGISIIF